MLPADVRRQLGIGEGEVLLVKVEDGKITLTSRKEALRRVQAYFKQFEPDRVWSEELMEERRREAQAELED